MAGNAQTPNIATATAVIDMPTGVSAGAGAGASACAQGTVGNAVPDVETPVVPVVLNSGVNTAPIAGPTVVVAAPEAEGNAPRN